MAIQIIGQVCRAYAVPTASHERRVCVCVRVRVCVYVCMYLHTCVHIHVWTDVCCFRPGEIRQTRQDDPTL